MKTCTQCKLRKPLTEFYASTGHSQAKMCYCKSCFNQRCIKRWIKRKADAIVYKGSECIDCGLKFNGKNHPVFDFHHRDPTAKDFAWVKLRLRSRKEINSELDKCDLLCANCHRMKHQE